MLIHFLYFYCKRIIITPYDDYDKHLAIVGDKVRMAYDSDNDEFTIKQGLTRLKQGNLNICGKESDPGVIPCEEVFPKSLFKFIKYNGYINIVSEDELCLTIRGIDNATNGNYLNLSPCEDLEIQKFRYFKVVPTNDPEKDGVYKVRRRGDYDI